jgi:hypothetical protein
MLRCVRRALLSLVLAGLTAAGCTSTTGPEPSGEPDYPRRTSPENVIAKFEMAYEAMDAEEYFDCLSEDFVFFVNPSDTLGFQPLPASWGRAVEDTIARRMFRESSGIDSIWVGLTQYGDPEEIPSQEPGELSSWRYTETAHVRVYLPQDFYFYADCEAAFVVRPDEDDAGLPGEVLWEICEWHDFEDPPGPSRELPSWSRIKAYFGGLFEESENGGS